MFSMMSRDNCHFLQVAEHTDQQLPVLQLTLLGQTFCTLTLLLYCCSVSSSLMLCDLLEVKLTGFETLPFW